MKAITSVNCFEKKRYPAIQNCLISENLKSSGFTFDPTKKKETAKSWKTEKEPTQIPDPTKRSLWNVVTLRLDSCFPEHKWRQNSRKSIDGAGKTITKCVS